ncbi:aldehyde dehydrogenase family protein [Actinomycetota bacterium Odt1-20B]
MHDVRDVELGPGARTYGSYVRGGSVPGEQWVYVVDAAALLDDAYTPLTLKRKLDKGQIPREPLPASIVGRVARASTDVLQQALEAAAEAAPAWASTPLEVRLDAVCALLCERVVERAGEIEEVLVREGHPRALARWQLSGMLAAWGPESVAFHHTQMHHEFRHGAREISVRRRPDGVVCLNPPQNAPMSGALLGVHALCAGNALVVRAPRSGPLGVMYALQELVAPVLEEVGAPPGTLGAVCGDPGPVLSAWLRSPLVDDVMYFGASEAGLRFQQRCVAAGKKPVLELAGNDTVTVWKDADCALAAEALAEGFFGSGQLCMVPAQVLVHPAAADRLLAELVRQARLVRPGRAGDEGVLLTPVARGQRFFGCLEDALGRGAELVCGGHAMRVDGTRDPAGPFLEPTVVLVRGLAGARRIAAVREDTFLPLLPVIVAEPAADDVLLGRFVQFVNSNGHGLRNSLWAADRAVVDRFVDRVTAGGLLKVNDSHIGFLPGLPSHGGTGLTGGVFGEANYPMLRTTHVQGVSVAAGGIRPREAVFGTDGTAAAG